MAKAHLPIPPSPPDPLLTGLIDVATDKLVLKPLLDAAPAEYRELIALYVPALRKFTETELFMFSQSASAGEPNDAAKVIRSKMSAEELVAEKKELVKLTGKMADIAHDRLIAQQAMLRATMFAALKLAMLAAA